MSDWDPRNPLVSVGQMVEYVGSVGHTYGERGKVVLVHPNVSFAPGGRTFYFVTVDRDAGRRKSTSMGPLGKFIAADYTLRVYGHPN